MISVKPSKSIHTAAKHVKLGGFRKVKKWVGAQGVGQAAELNLKAPNSFS